MGLFLVLEAQNKLFHVFLIYCSAGLSEKVQNFILQNTDQKQVTPHESTAQYRYISFEWSSHTKG